jgi:2-polyprenyl-3-methyl-5-hydroxy-6-metoxy-1,4-benzoquinol methylase
MKNICSFCNNPLKIKFAENIIKFDKLYDVYICETCMIGFSIPMPSEQDLAGFYLPGAYRLDTGKRFSPIFEYLIYFFRLLRKREIQKYVKNGSILDIGCGRGLFLNLMKKHGWEVAGVEFDEETALQVSKAYGIKVIPSQSISKLPDNSFDVITLFHVLEHTINPQMTINESKRLLKEGGLLVVEVPNLSSLQASIGKKAWFHLDVPHHFYHFSDAGIKALLRKNSFRILRVQQFSLEYNPFGWLQTLLNMSGLRENLFYNLLKSRELREKEMSVIRKKDLFLTFMLLPIFLPLSFVFSMFESFFLRKGGTIGVYAVKEQKAGVSVSPEVL